MSNVSCELNWRLDGGGNKRCQAKGGDRDRRAEELSLRATALMVGLWLATVSVAQQHHASIDIRYDTR